MRNLSIIILVLAAIAASLRLNYGAPSAAPSPELRQYLMYIVTAALVGFVAYLAMTRR